MSMTMRKMVGAGWAGEGESEGEGEGGREKR
jgi:hypothetical protein